MGACRACRGEKEHSRSWYCDACATARFEARARDNHVCSAPTATPHWECKACWQMKQDNRRRAARVAMETRTRTQPHRVRPQHASEFWQRKAMSMVAAAKKHGLLPKLDGSIACVVCGTAAHVYEHRDYSRPLDVEPVCHSCNHKRGTAIWPDDSRFQFKRVEFNNNNAQARGVKGADEGRNGSSS